MGFLTTLLIVLSQQLPPAPPPPPTARLAAAEEAALLPVVAAWEGKRTDPASQLVIAWESLPIYPQAIPVLRLELLRHGVAAPLAEQLLDSLLRRNSQMCSIESTSLAGATRLSFRDVLIHAMDPKSASEPSLSNLGQIRVLAIPGTAGESAVIFYAVGAEMTNSLYAGTRMAFVSSGALIWEQPLTKFDFRSSPYPDKLPHQAEFSQDDVAVIQAVVDHHFPDRHKPLWVVNQTFPREDVHDVALFIPRLDLDRPITMVPRERTLTFRSSELGNAAGIVAVTFPQYTADRKEAQLDVTLATPRDTGIEMATARARLNRVGAAWLLVSDDYRVQAYPGSKAIDQSVPLRVGGDVTAPILMKRVEPQFPTGTRRGIILMEIVVGADGHVTQASTLTPLDPAAEKMAVDAVRQWEFRPGTLNGRPVPVIYNVTLRVP